MAQKYRGKADAVKKLPYCYVNGNVSALCCHLAGKTIIIDKIVFLERQYLLNLRKYFILSTSVKNFSNGGEKYDE